MITILGPTASGKTKLAARLAKEIDGEIISADSRQVYRGMDMGTGKDYDDYVVDGKIIKYHLIDIADPGDEYNVYCYQKDFLRVYEQIKSEVILCGGTGLYLNAVIKGYELLETPINNKLREKLKDYSDKELVKILETYKKLHNVTDTKDRSRLLRAIEIREHNNASTRDNKSFPEIQNIVFGIHLDRTIIRNKITERLKQRLEDGMIEEVRTLLTTGLKPEQLIFYGLEYKYLTQYVTGEISYDFMFTKLNTAIHQFAKRQMTWFRKMQNEGVIIHWLDGQRDIDENVKIMINTVNV
jgi:tRNA dimethylallyltransferase